MNDSTTDNEAENTYFAARHGYNSSFKSNKVTTKPYNAAVFNHCQLQNIHVILTEQGYSAVDVNTTLTKCKISMINKKADDFHMKFFHIDHLITSNNKIIRIHNDFSDQYLLFVIDMNSLESVFDI